MPELPEIETVRLGLSPHLAGRRIAALRVRETRLRWPVADGLAARLRDETIRGLQRRGKYLLLRLDRGWLMWHLGMSGSLRMTSPAQAPGRHDHVDLELDDGGLLRYRDPRRFGALLWCEDPERHPLLAHLGVEPLSDAFDGDCLHTLCRGRATAIKTTIMDARRVVGIGNIYANESLFHAGIDPRLATGRLSRTRAARLAQAIRDTLTRAIAAGGSSLRDFVDGEGRPGYFQQSYAVYDRAGLACTHCGAAIRRIIQANRSTFFCPRCQRR